MKESLAAMSNNWSFFKRLVITSLIPSLCAISLLFFGFFPLSLSVAKKNDLAAESVLSGKIEAELQQFDTAAAEVMSAIENSEWLHPLFFEHVLHEADVTQVMNTRVNTALKTLVLKNSRVQTVALQFYTLPNEMYSSNGLFFNLELHQSMSDDLKYRFFPAAQYGTGLSGVFQNDAAHLLYCQSFRDIPDGRAKGEVNIFLSTQPLETLLVREGISSMRLFRPDGSTAWSYGDEDDISRCVKVQGTSASGSCLYTYYIPKSLHNRNILQIEAIMLPAILVVTLVTAVLSYLFSKKNYQPVTNVVNALRDPGEAEPEDISVAALEDLVDSMLARRQANERKIETLKPLAQQDMLGAILSGEAFLQGFGRGPEEYDLVFPGPRFTVLALENTREEAGELLGAHPLPVLRFGDESGLPDRQFLACVYRNYFGKYLVLVNYSEQEQLISFISRLRNEFASKSVQDASASRLHCGIGSEVDTLEDVYRSAEQASTALNYAVLNQMDDSVRWSEIAELVSSEYSYTFSDEMLLSSAIMAGDREGSMEIVRRVVNQNILAAETNPRLVKSLYYDLRSTVIRSRQRKGLQMENDDKAVRAPGDFNELTELLDQQIGEICDMIVNSCSYSVSEKDAEIFDYIDRNLYNYGLSLSNVAERFHMSETYVSKLFKSQRAINYNDYVNGKRIEKAVEIISQEHPPINTVYKRVGYISDSTFRRNFIKYTRKNPSDL